MTPSRSIPYQHTLKREVVTSGIGLFTGERCTVRIGPAPTQTGIVFQRTDLPRTAHIPARVEFVQPAPRCTRLANGEASITMVEHLLSALYGLGVDNARIAVEGPEIPAGDGSAKLFVDLIEQVGLQEQKGALREPLYLSQPLFWSEGEIHLIALPSSSLRLSYTLHYPQSPLVRSQYYSCLVHPKSYCEEIAPCRTFSFYEEILPFIEKGLIKGGGLENALVIRGDRILNPEGLRFPDEMVRHKILDLLGDLSLVGAPLCAHILAVRSGHASNLAFAKMLEEHLLKDSRESLACARGQR